MRATVFEVDTRNRWVVDVTEAVRRFASESNESGLLHAFLPHATAGLAVMEAGAGSEEDLEEVLQRLLPRDERYVHRHGSIGHGGDHLLPAFVSPSLVLPVDGGTLVLGAWQHVVVVDPNRENNRRSVRLSFVPA